MAVPKLDELLALDVQTRPALAADWNSVVKDAQLGVGLPVTESERAELDKRLHEDDADPGAAIPWAEVRARLRDQ